MKQLPDRVSTQLYANCRRKAREDDREFTITLEFIQQLFDRQNKCCALTGVPIEFGIRPRTNNTASLDRIDSNRGYVPDNVQWVHKVVQRMKSNIDQAEFITWCNRVIVHNTRDKTNGQ